MHWSAPRPAHATDLLDLRLYLPAAQVDNAAALAAWADLAQDPMELGVRGRLSPTEAPLPWPGLEQTALAGLAGRPASALHALRAEGAIGPATLQRQTRAAAASLAERDHTHWSASTGSLVKEATFQALYFVDALGVYWIVAGNAGQGLVYASINSVVQPVLAYSSGKFWAEPAAAAPAAASAQ